MECLTVIWSLEKLLTYLEGVPFTVVTDHYSLLWLQSLKDLNGCLVHWTVRLEFDFKLVNQKWKEHIVPDTLFRAVPVIDSVDIGSNFDPNKCYQKMLNNVKRNPLKFAAWRVANYKLFKYVHSQYSSMTPVSKSLKLIGSKADRLKILVSGHDVPTEG